MATEDVPEERRTAVAYKYKKLTSLASLATAVAMVTASIDPAQTGSGRIALRDSAAYVQVGDGLRGAPVQNPRLVGQWDYAGRPFFPSRRLVTPYDGVGVFYEPFLSCWTWIPANLGWQRVLDCKNAGSSRYGQFVAPFSGISAFYSYGPSYPSCWTWLPTKTGRRRLNVCHWPYGLGYDYY